MQYPAGQRPCNEALAALDAVTAAQLEAGAGPSDPDGEVRDALEHAKTMLTNRAGESEHYSAVQYNALADTVSDQIDPLIEQYDQEDPDTPYTEATDYSSRDGLYDAARRRLVAECDSLPPPRPSVSSNPTLPATTTPPVPTTTTPAGPADTFGEGTYLVGVDIQPGTYRSAGPTEIGTCYWFRLKDTTGDSDSTLASNGSRGPSTVTIKASDGALRTSGCAPWEKVS